MKKHYKVGDKIKVPSLETLLNMGWERENSELRFNYHESMVDESWCGRTVKVITVTGKGDGTTNNIKVKRLKNDPGWWININHFTQEGCASCFAVEATKIVDGIDSLLLRQLVFAELVKELGYEIEG